MEKKDLPPEEELSEIAPQGLVVKILSYIREKDKKMLQNILLNKLLKPERKEYG